MAYSSSKLGKGAQAHSITGSALARSELGRRIVASLRMTYMAPTDPAIGIDRGRVIVLIHGAGLAMRPVAEQVVAGRQIAGYVRSELADGPWYARRLVSRALTAVFEDHALEGGCEVQRYAECTVLAPS